MLPWALVLLSLVAPGRPAPTTPGPLRTVTVDCHESALLQEMLYDIRELQEDTKATALDMTEPEDNIFTYLERIIQVLDLSNQPMEKKVASSLRKILAARNSCTGWTKSDWELGKEKNLLFQSLEYSLRFLNHNAYTVEEVQASKKIEAPTG